MRKCEGVYCCGDAFFVPVFEACGFLCVVVDELGAEGPHVLVVAFGDDVAL